MSEDENLSPFPLRDRLVLLATLTLTGFAGSCNVLGGLQPALYHTAACISLLAATELAKLMRITNIRLDLVSYFVCYRSIYAGLLFLAFKQLPFVTWYSRKTITSRKGEVTEVVHEHSLEDFSPLSKIWSSLMYLDINLLGSPMYVEYLANPPLNQEVIDEYQAKWDTAELETSLDDSYTFQFMGLAASIMLLTYCLAGPVGVSIALSVVLVLHSKRREEKSLPKPVTHTSKGKPIPRKTGIYALYTETLGGRNYRGIGWVDNGTLYTRYHVTNGNDIDFGVGTAASPCYISKAKDNVAYGSPPTYAQVMDGQEVTVAIASPYSAKPVLYRTHVTKTKTGLLIFPGNRTMPGCSGSPAFVEKQEEIVDETGSSHMVTRRAYCGCIGWFYDSKPQGMASNDKVGCELMGEESASHGDDVPISDSEVHQLFMHPGAGKTRKIMPGLTTKGLNKYGRVYITGPTKVVCQELFKAFEDMPEFKGKVSLMTSAASMLERGSSIRPIIIAAHATMLRMLIRGNEAVRTRGLWIMDEAHFCNSKTLMLKDYLRDKIIRGEGSSVEMTATGWDFRAEEMVMMEASNYPIDEHVMSEAEMISDLENHDEGVSVVFVTSIEGRESTSARSLENRLKGKLPTTRLNRKTFNTNYLEASRMDKGVILTTDISECGANFQCDRVYDFQLTTKALIVGNHVAYEQRMIDQGQRIQRKGRCGRFKPGDYYCPGRTLPETDLDRVEHYDRKVFSESMKIDIREPHITSKVCTLTPAQIASWISTDESSIESPWLIELLTSPSGGRRDDRDLSKRITYWARSTQVHARIGEDVFTCGFWDERDKDKLRSLAKPFLKGVEPDNHQAALNAIKLWTRGLKDSLIPLLRPEKAPETGEPETEPQAQDKVLDDLH